MTALGTSSAPCGCGGTTGGTGTSGSGGSTGSSYPAGSTHPPYPSGPSGSSGPCGPGAAGTPGTSRTSGTAGTSPEPCPQDELPVNPFLALRVAFGMLLGEDDFRVLMGNPRGKQMMHSAWLHGPGVIWGLGLTLDADGDTLRVAPGLAVDGWGRELSLEASWCLSLRQWAACWVAEHPLPPPGAGQERRERTGQRRDEGGDPCPEQVRTVTAWVVAEFGAWPDRPVPALADPCDITRRHDDFSRVVESARITVRSEAPPPRHAYHRVRVLLGLDQVGEHDPAGREAAVAAEEVREAPPSRRTELLLCAFRRLAALDATWAAPESEDGDACPPLLPVTEDHAPVVLAKLTVEIVQQTGCVRAVAVDLDQEVRAAILPTDALQELLCGLAPALLGEGPVEDAGGPRLLPDSVDISRGNTCLSFCLTKPVDRASLAQAITITSLSEHGAGWAESEVQQVRLTDRDTRAVVDLELPPAHGLVRVLIRGTGPRPCYGTEPRVPFAGLAGGPSASRHDGHDAAVTVHLHHTAGAGRAES